MLNVNQLRHSFLEYFKKNNHKEVASSSLVPLNDPSLMFVNSGMVQFKNYFTGAEKPNFTRATTSQKCVRAGGKHNDLDNVGYTARHHTFFEMLGNFSFGDYFKEDAIKFAWEYLTKEIGLPKDKLLVTVYHTDDQAYDLWKKIAHLTDEKIIRITTNDNFWSMGDTGPCGPCSEIFYDHGEEIFGGPPGSPTQDGDRFIEIWNLVFMQYEQIDANTKIALPKPSIDTGMGLERIAAVLQKQHDNYNIDLFKYLIDSASDILGVKITKQNLNSFKVIADHLRSCSFLIASSIFPSNEGRGYVVRRIMRRAMRHLHMLGARDAVMYKLYPALMSQMGEAYPELIQAHDIIVQVLATEENKFKQTLDKGLKLLHSHTENLKKNQELPGDVAFKLYDTYGFPLDLTMDILKAKNLKIDLLGFEADMEEQRKQSRAAWLGSGDKTVDALWFDLKEKCGATEFVGYTADKAEALVSALIQNGEQVEQVTEENAEFLMVVNQTPFYGESGGQVGDRGLLTGENGLEVHISDTKKYFGNLHVHLCVLTKGKIKAGDKVNLAISVSYRKLLRANHSATHLLHAVLREVLGTHVTQKGSLVVADYLRFDFSHATGLSLETLQEIETKVNALIINNTPIKTILMSTKQAIEHGAMALFGEKYDEEVRVVSMGVEVDHDGDHEVDYSTELCGGTHVRATGDIGCFKIIKEAAIASGIRRIEAKTGLNALKIAQDNDNIITNLSVCLKTPRAELTDRVANLITEKTKLDRELQNLKRKILLEESMHKIEEINKMQVIAIIINDLEIKDLRILAEDLRNKFKDNIIVVLTSIVNEQAATVITLSNDLTDKVKANTLLEIVTNCQGGSGGGKAGLAQSGGGNALQANHAFEKIKHHLINI